MKIVILLLFILGGIFMWASHIPIWFLTGEKPTHPSWKIYGLIGIIIWFLILLLGNIVL